MGAAACVKQRAAAGKIIVQSLPNFRAGIACDASKNIDGLG